MGKGPSKNKRSLLWESNSFLHKTYATDDLNSETNVNMMRVIYHETKHTLNVPKHFAIKRCKASGCTSDKYLDWYCHHRSTLLHLSYHEILLNLQ